LDFTLTLTEKRLKALNDARGILDTAKAQNRGMHAEEVRRYDAFIAEADSLRATIDRETTADRLDNEARNRVPDCIRDTDRRNAIDPDAIVLTKDQRCADYVRSRDVAYASETARGERLSLGKIVLAMATGKRDGMR
jgi:hypothetical protein